MKSVALCVLFILLASCKCVTAGEVVSAEVVTSTATATVSGYGSVGTSHPATRLRLRLVREPRTFHWQPARTATWGTYRVRTRARVVGYGSTGR